MTTKELYLALLEELTNEKLIREVNWRLKKLEVTRAHRVADTRIRQKEENAILSMVLTEAPMTGDDIVNALAENGIIWTEQKVAVVAKRLIEAGLVVTAPQITEDWID